MGEGREGPDQSDDSSPQQVINVTGVPIVAYAASQ
jgi:hypothetical protein